MQAPITCGVKGQTATKLHSMSRKLVWELTEFANNIELRSPNSVLLAVAGDWCWFVVRKNYYWLAGG